MTDVDPQFPRYRIDTTIDGPRKTDGELVFELHGRAVVVPDDEKLAAGEPIRVFIYDFAGPRTAPEPLEGADAAVAAALNVATDSGALPYREGTPEDAVRNEDYIRRLLGAADECMPHVSGETAICLECLKIALPSCEYGGHGLETLEGLAEAYG